MPIKSLVPNVSNVAPIHSLVSNVSNEMPSVISSEVRIQPLSSNVLRKGQYLRLKCFVSALRNGHQALANATVSWKLQIDEEPTSAINSQFVANSWTSSGSMISFLAYPLMKPGKHRFRCTETLPDSVQGVIPEYSANIAGTNRCSYCKFISMSCQITLKTTRTLAIVSSSP